MSIPSSSVPPCKAGRVHRRAERCRHFRPPDSGGTFGLLLDNMPRTVEGQPRRQTLPCSLIPGRGLQLTGRNHHQREALSVRRTALS
jgi:hypothetical protein